MFFIKKNCCSLLPFLFVVGLHKRDYSVLSCWAVDSFHNFPYSMRVRFKNLTLAIRDQSIEEVTNGKKWVVVDGNCPLFRYWLDSPETCKRIKSLGYIGKSVSCVGDGERKYAQLVHTMFQRHFRFRESFMKYVELILEPYRNQLIVDADNHYLFPFPKFRNVVTVHARFGGGSSDFSDLFTFLNETSTEVFIKCLKEHSSPSVFIYVASDSTTAKRSIHEYAGENYIHSPVKVGHSGLLELRWYQGYLKPQIYTATRNALADLIIASMGQSFIGTGVSSFSAMISMISGAETFIVTKESDQCSPHPLYLPSYVGLYSCFLYEELNAKVRMSFTRRTMKSSMRMKLPFGHSKPLCLKRKGNER